jgi:hypothetical protein
MIVEKTVLVHPSMRDRGRTAEDEALVPGEEHKK